MLKIYAKGYCWRGSTLVVAESRIEAVDMMRGTDNFSEDLKPEDLEEIEIKPGLIWVNLGDS